jgi:ribosomal protein S18 acetylase RimI-like enzyme
MIKIITIDPPTHRPFVRRLSLRFWKDVRVATRGVLLDNTRLSGFIARKSNRPVGLLTYRIGRGEMTLVTLASAVGGRGIGTALLQAAVRLARRRRCRRVITCITNDNLGALRFYQRRGFTMTAIRRGAMASARRRLKPSIPRIGNFGIPIDHEIVLAIHLKPKTS